MSTSINLHYGSWETLVNAFVKRGAPKELVVKAMELLGIHAGDQYIILYNEKYEDCNPAFVLTNILDKTLPDYKTDEYLENDCFEILLNNTKMKECLTVEDAKERLGVK